MPHASTPGAQVLDLARVPPEVLYRVVQAAVWLSLESESGVVNGATPEAKDAVKNLSSAVSALDAYFKSVAAGAQYLTRWSATEDEGHGYAPAPPPDWRL